MRGTQVSIADIKQGSGKRKMSDPAMPSLKRVKEDVVLTGPALVRVQAFDIYNKLKTLPIEAIVELVRYIYVDIRLPAAPCR